MISSRADILKRIDQAKLAMTAPSPARDYATTTTASHLELLDLLEDRILDYKATFTRSTDVESTIAGIIAAQGLKAIVVPPDLASIFTGAKVDTNLSSDQLDHMDAVVTASEIAIAVTGTIILNHSRLDQGRRAISLVPDTHICIVKAANVVGTVVEAVRKLNPRDHQTWISGPSATSDIELERVEGVHGPRNLHVILDLS